MADKKVVNVAVASAELRAYNEQLLHAVVSHLIGENKGVMRIAMRDLYRAGAMAYTSTMMKDADTGEDVMVLQRVTASR